jgi:hypothetical protein
LPLRSSPARRPSRFPLGWRKELLENRRGLLVLPDDGEETGHTAKDAAGNWSQTAGMWSLDHGYSTNEYILACRSQMSGPCVSFGTFRAHGGFSAGPRKTSNTTVDKSGLNHDMTL